MNKLRYLWIPSITVGALMTAQSVSNSLWFEQLWWGYHYH